jgi:hypothetical protein
MTGPALADGICYNCQAEARARLTGAAPLPNASTLANQISQIVNPFQAPTPQASGSPMFSLAGSSQVTNTNGSAKTAAANNSWDSSSAAPGSLPNSFQAVFGSAPGSAYNPNFLLTGYQMGLLNPLISNLVSDQLYTFTPSPNGMPTAPTLTPMTPGSALAGN